MRAPAIADGCAGLAADFFGSGLFFPAFRGNVSAEFFADAGYEAYSLGYRDYAAYVDTAGDPDGTLTLAAHLARRRALDPSLPRATASNLYLSGTALDPHVQRYTVAPLSGGRELALSMCGLEPSTSSEAQRLLMRLGSRRVAVSLLDRFHLAARNPSLAARVVGFRKALHMVLAELRRRPGGLPEVVVVAIEGAHQLRLDYEEADVNGDETATSEGSWEVVRQLALEADEVDLILTMTKLPKDRWQAPSWVQAWLGHHVMIVPDQMADPISQFGLNISLALDDAGRLLPNSSFAMHCHLGCDAPSVAAAHEKLLEHHAQMDAQQSEVAGYLDTEGATAGKAEQLGDCVTLPAAGPACGCYVAECAVYRSGGSNP